MTTTPTPTPVRELDRPPNLISLFGKAALTSLRPRPGGRAELPPTTYARSGVTVDAQTLADYNRVCGFRQSDELPLTFPHLLAFPLQAKLMTDDDFPFGMVGLVHVANRITQVRPLRLDEPLSVQVRAADLRAHERGRQFDVISEVAVDGEVVWTDVSTYLRKEAGNGRADQRRPQVDALPNESVSTAVWRVPADAGRRYARVSGDHNPIHLYPVTARAFGFRRAIVHGMWSKARCLASFEGRLPAGYTVDVRFKLPILLPARVVFHAAHSAGGGWTFDLADARTGKPHLTGTITATAGSRPSTAEGHS